MYVVPFWELISQKHRINRIRTCEFGIKVLDVLDTMGGKPGLVGPISAYRPRGVLVESYRLARARASTLVPGTYWVAQRHGRRHGGLRSPGWATLPYWPRSPDRVPRQCPCWFRTWCGFGPSNRRLLVRTGQKPPVRVFKQPVGGCRYEYVIPYMIEYQ